MEGGKFYFSALLLSLLAVIAFAAQSLVAGFTGAFVLDSGLLAERPWTLVTSIFLHGSLVHLLSNIFALGLFGSILEKLIGTRRFLAYFFATGLLASLISAAVYPASLGASGAIFGVLGALAAMRPRMVVWTYGVPMPMFVAAGFWLLLDIGGVFFPSNIANMAHIAGMVSGIAIGLSARPEEEKKREKPKALSNRELEEWEEEWM